MITLVLIGVLVLTWALAYANFYLIRFVDFCLQDGNIFDFWGNYVRNVLVEKNRKLAKVLGWCPICYGFWLSLITFTFFHLTFKIPVEFVLPYVSITEYLLIKHFYDD